MSLWLAHMRVQLATVLFCRSRPSGNKSSGGNKVRATLRRVRVRRLSRPLMASVSQRVGAASKTGTFESRVWLIWRSDLLNYRDAIDVLKHGAGRSHDRLLGRKARLDFRFLSARSVLP